MHYAHKSAISRDEAETLALSALRFLASDPALWSRFEALTGVDAASVRRLAAEPDFLAGVLEFLLQHESALLVFCAHEDIAPERPARAHRLLSGGAYGA
ncbi:MAG: DUF3572 domain-containing protein [Hyphomicrobiales bacterium]|nr:MAG: DUF3572 domain-containing protein [Hyphomicrobiales bacterium]